MAKKIDVTGRACPIPIVELMRAMGTVAGGEEVEIRADDRAFPADVKAWCAKTGHSLLELSERSDTFVARVRKKAAP